MTWNARATVTEVTGSDPVRVTAVADAESPPARPWGPDGPEVATITSNTEGTIGHATLALLIDGDTAPLQVGDLITISGHFDRVERSGAAPQAAADE